MYSIFNIQQYHTTNKSQRCPPHFLMIIKKGKQKRKIMDRKTVFLINFNAALRFRWSLRLSSHSCFYFFNTNATFKSNLFSLFSVLFVDLFVVLFVVLFVLLDLPFWKKRSPLLKIPKPDSLNASPPWPLWQQCLKNDANVWLKMEEKLPLWSESWTFARHKWTSLAWNRRTLLWQKLWFLNCLSKSVQQP